MAKINASNYSVKFTDKFFFDTNVWLLLYGTIANFQKQDQKIYSGLFSEILTRNSSIYINSLVVSEFANVILRKDFNQWVTNEKLVNQNYKKDFVGTTEYKNSVLTVTNLINKILGLPVIVPVSDDFTSIDKGTILKYFQDVDFNDAYILKTCEDKDYILVTNDGDFDKISHTVDVISK